MRDPIITVAGLRGVIGEALNPEVAMHYACAFASACKPNPDGKPYFIITRDGRATGSMLADVIHATLNALGHPTLDCGVQATPTTGILVRQLNARGAIQISASHNPVEYNGLKLISSQGRCITK